MATQTTTLTGMLRKTLLIAFFFTGIFTAASATEMITATVPAIHFAADNDEKDNSVFQTNVYVVHNTNTVKVFINDPASKGAVIFIRNNKGHVIHKNGFIDKQKFMGKFDLSRLPDGLYSMEIYAFAKSGLGLGKKQYTTTFEIQTQTRRSLSLQTAIDKMTIAHFPWQHN